jgi:hypothetical protein
MREKILTYVRERRYVSFVELERFLGGEMSGDFNLFKGDNVVLWSGVSERFAEAFASLVETGQVRLVPTSPLVYLIDGKALRLPLVKGRYRYKKPHWLPVVLDIPARNGKQGANK